MSITDTLGAAQIELDTLTSLQKKYHHPEKDDEVIQSRFFYVIKKTPWSVKCKEELKSVSSTNVIEFSANNKFDILLNVYLTQKIKSVRVSEKYRGKVQICFTHNLGHHITPKGVCSSDGNVIQHLDDTWLDIHSQFYIKGEGRRRHYNLMIGNVPFLEDWGDSLPSYELVIPQPYYHCNDSLGLPLYLESLSKVTYKYELRRKLSELIRMRARVNTKTDEWKEIRFNKKYIEGGDQMLDLPEMWGEYVLLTDSEREWRKTRKDDMTGMPIKPQTVYAENIINMHQDNISYLGENVSVQLNSSLPVKAIFWIAKNMDAVEMNNLSNYTTNTGNILEGWNPISRMGLSYGGVKRILDMSHIHFDMAEPWFRFEPPSEPGYNGYSIGYDTTSLHADVGVVYNKVGQVKINVQLDDTEPSVTSSKELPVENDDDEEFIPDELSKKPHRNTKEGPPYKIHVYLLVTTELTFPFEGKVEINKGHVSSE